MSDLQRQVFFSETRSRWKRFLWVVRLGAAVMAVATIAVTVAVVKPEEIGLPKLLGRNDTFKKLLEPDHTPALRTNANVAYQQNRGQITNGASFNYTKRPRTRPVKSVPSGAPIRAAFYVNWDAQSLFSLRDNLDHLTVVFPEWLFIAANADTLTENIDNRALDVIREKGVPIIPMVSNYIDESWNGESVRRILHSPEHRKALITSILHELKQNDFAGVNIDFESLGETSDEPLVVFLRELYTTLHPAGLLVTIDVPPEDSDYNLSALEHWCDYIVVMSYDQHYSESVAGPVADHRWFTAILDEVTSVVPGKKLIIGLPAYGYDWPSGGEGNEVSYYEALTTAKESDAKVEFDEEGFNLHFGYQDDSDRTHDVYFVDAATTFNELRAVCGSDAAGVALWRLGSEDPRIWNFFTLNLQDSLKKSNPFDFNLLKVAPAKTDIDFEGEGEILNVVEQPESGEVNITVDSTSSMIDNETYAAFPSPYVVKKYGKLDHAVALTFDDGPDEKFTPQILDILTADHVPATFFVVGINVENNIGLLKRIYDSGYDIGNHSFTHPNLAEVNPERTRVELQATRRIIESITGHSTILFRPPYNADSEPESMEEISPVQLGKEEDYYTIAESIDPQDWNEGITADSILARVIRESGYGSIVLLHDAGGDRSETVKALPRIIDYFRGKGFRFVSIEELMGKTRDEIMPAVSGTNQLTITQFNWGVVEVLFWAGKILFWLFLFGIVLSIGRTTVTGILAAIQRKTRVQAAGATEQNSCVSVIVPAFNEEVNAVATVRSLLKSTVSNLEVVFVDDGSRDQTASVVGKAFINESRVRVFTKPNGGKASALNFGIAHATGEIVVCIDADTQLREDAIENLLSKFDAEGAVAAVAGNAKVGNERNILTRWQAIEYITSQNFDRRAFDLLNAIAVVPGAIGAFRKKAILEVGGFTNDTLAEDCDLTIRLLKAGYVIHYSPDAVAVTEAPETVRGFLKQRFRWSFGIMQTLWKHRGTLFSRRVPNVGFVTLPNILFFQFLMPLLSPLADLMMLLSLAGGRALEVFIYYAIFLFIDALGAWVAFHFENERTGRLWLLLPQRFMYRQLMYWVLLKSFMRAVRGELTHWGSLKRTGNVTLHQE
jgi:cellulose synthase/poly-beta-1,6-N-acetylglucosamine synthase-like glycosyltransferase/spore germination protein YaaH/peptidoglycan/xylan/chitin deacetylase (PgdA/CDA1 family)